MRLTLLEDHKICLVNNNKHKPLYGLFCLHHLSLFVGRDQLTLDFKESYIIN